MSRFSLIFLASIVFFKAEAKIAAKSSQLIKSPSSDLSRDALLAELTGKDLSKESEKSLFAQVVAGYQADNWSTIDRHLRALLSRFPQSPLADNAIYLAGLYKLNKKNYGDAVKYFNRIKKEYPNGNKRVSAEFAKAMSYKIMGLNDFSKNILSEVKKKFPGSPEAMRATNELKLMGVKK